MKEPMQDIWKGAPEGATHYSEENQLFYKKKDGALYFWRINLPHWWVRSDYDPDEYHLLKLIERPSQSWHERGELPPVGVECEYIGDPHDDEHTFCDWKKGDVLEVLAHREFKGVILAIVFNKRDCSATTIRRDLLGPLKSDREKAIDNLSDFIRSQIPCEKVDSDVCAGALYDAGYRKVE